MEKPKNWNELLHEATYVIAPFQRAYRWKTEMALRLWLDCYDHFATNSCAEVDDGYHLGSIITYKDNADEFVRYVVDGQQRLVTLWIFFRAMFFWCSHHEEDHERTCSNVVDIANGELAFPRKGRSRTRRLKFAARSTVDGFFERFFAKKIGYETDWDELKELICHDPPNDQEKKFVNVFRAALFFMCNHFGLPDDRGMVQSGNLDSKDYQTWILTHYRELYLDKTERCKKFGCANKIQAFAKFMVANLHVALISVESKTKAMQMYRSINNQRDHAETATEMEILKAMLQAPTNEHQTDKYSQWENCASEFRGTTRDELDLFAYYMHVIVELTPRPSGKLEKNSVEDFTKSPTQDNFEDEPYQCTLIEHIKRRFIVEDEQDRVRRKLFDVKNPTKLDENAVDLFFSKWMNTDSVVCFLGFLRVDDHRWAQGHYLGQTSSKRIQNTVTLLKHVAHTGLDMDWVAPAFFFAVKFRCMQSSDHLNAAAEFFDLLEKGFVAYNAFCKRGNGKAMFGRPGHSKTDAEQVFCRYMKHYRELIGVIYKEDNPTSILEWMRKKFVDCRHSLQEGVVDCFSQTVKFSTESAKAFYKVRATYLLLKAECVTTPDESELYTKLSGWLPSNLRGGCPRGFACVDRTHGPIALEHIHPESNLGDQDAWAADDHKNMVDNLGNYCLLVPEERNAFTGSTFLQKKRMLERSGFGLSKRIAARDGQTRDEWSTKDVKQRRKELLRHAVCGWVGAVEAATIDDEAEVDLDGVRTPYPVAEVAQEEAAAEVPVADAQNKTSLCSHLYQEDNMPRDVEDAKRKQWRCGELLNRNCFSAHTYKEWRCDFERVKQCEDTCDGSKWNCPKFAAERQRILDSYPNIIAEQDSNSDLPEMPQPASHSVPNPPAAVPSPRVRTVGIVHSSRRSGRGYTGKIECTHEGSRINPMPTFDDERQDLKTNQCVTFDLDLTDPGRPRARNIQLDTRSDLQRWMRNYRRMLDDRAWSRLQKTDTEAQQYVRRRVEAYRSKIDNFSRFFEYLLNEFEHQRRPRAPLILRSRSRRRGRSRDWSYRGRRKRR
ncbi:unnamed protein product [Durusdinium trenchii]|uniref:DUF262 domain-containing protein n=1 Tax=Durusdinium trenchii TaxID=1381693 RepID=A0ABP0L2S1_9DINO